MSTLLSQKESEKRIIWCDIVKGFLICCVVLGHSEMTISGVFNWFHIPLFFVMAGLVLKLPNDELKIGLWIRKKGIRLLIPYVIYTIIYWISMGEYSIHSLVRMILFNIWGGRIRNTYTVNWYITCLFLSYIVMSLINRHIKSNKMKAIVLVGMTLIGILETYTLIPAGGAGYTNMDVFSMER